MTNDFTRNGPSPTLPRLACTIRRAYVPPLLLVLAMFATGCGGEGDGPLQPGERLAAPAEVRAQPDTVFVNFDGYEVVMREELRVGPTVLAVSNGSSRACTFTMKRQGGTADGAQIPGGPSGGTAPVSDPASSAAAVEGSPGTEEAPTTDIGSDVEDPEDTSGPGEHEAAPSPQSAASGDSSQTTDAARITGVGTGETAGNWPQEASSEVAPGGTIHLPINLEIGAYQAWCSGMTGPISQQGPNEALQVVVGKGLTGGRGEATSQRTAAE